MLGALVDLPKLRKPPPKAEALAGVCERFSPGGSDSAHTFSGLRWAHRPPKSSNTRGSRAQDGDTLAAGHRSLAGVAGTSPSSTRSPDPQDTRQASPPATRGRDRLRPRTPTTKTHGTTSAHEESPPSGEASRSSTPFDDTLWSKPNGTLDEIPRFHSIEVLES